MQALAKPLPEPAAGDLEQSTPHAKPLPHVFWFEHSQTPRGGGSGMFRSAKAKSFPELAQVFTENLLALNGGTLVRRDDVRVH